MKKLLLEYINSILHEYTDEEKREMGIPLDAEGKSGKWYNKNGVYIGRTRDGKFVPAGTEPQGDPGTKSKQPRSGTQKSRPVRSTPSTDSPPKVLRSATDAERSAVRAIYPDAREIDVIAELDHEEIQKITDELGISSGETDLSPDMEPVSEEYFGRSLVGDDYGDDAYYSRMELSGLRIRSPLYKVSPGYREMLLARGFPEHYIQLIERSMNTERRGDEPKFTEMLPGVGAGQNQSQFGEIISMTMMALPPEVRQEFADELSATIGTPGVQKKQDLIGPVADISWVQAAVGHADSFDTMMNEQYGNGKWRLEATAWDRRSDIEAIGLPYANKGFSTDVVLRVQPLDGDGNPVGPAQAQRVSLKKDERVMLFNGGIGEVDNLMMQGYLTEQQYHAYGALARIDSLLKSKVPGQRQLGLRLAARAFDQEFSDVRAAQNRVAGIRTNLESLARQQAPDEVVAVRDRVASFSEDQKESAVGVMVSVVQDDSLADLSEAEVDELIDQSLQTDAHKKQAKKFWKVLMECKRELEGSGGAAPISKENIETCVTQKVGSKSLEVLSKMGTFVGKVAAAANPELHQENINNHMDLAVKLGNDYMRIFRPDNPEMLGGLMGVLGEKFPLNVVMSGTEQMVINGVHISKNTLKTMFGVESYKELELGLKILSIDGTPMLVYQAKGSDEPIIIGTVDARQKGRGYSNVGFEIKCSDEFVLKAAEANETNGNSSPSNTGAVKRISGRLKKRNAKNNLENQ
jgi:hypothetical protein